METASNAQERPDVSVEERSSRDVIKRILKLRWIGMQEEAEEMQLALRRIDPECTLLAHCVDTD